MSIAQESAECGHFANTEQIANAVIVKVVKGETTVYALRAQTITVNNTVGGDDIQPCSGHMDFEERLVRSVGIDIGGNAALNILDITDSGATVTEVPCGGYGMTKEELFNMVFNHNPATGQSGITILRDV
jgi:Tfp pilus assembly protein PilW